MDDKKTNQNGKDIGLILYRLTAVESAVKDVSSKLDKQDNIKRSDLREFRDTIVSRMTDMQNNFQRQLDDKADASSVSDLKKLIAAVSSVFGSIIGALIVYFITHGVK